MKLKFIFPAIIALCSFSFCNDPSIASADASASANEDKENQNKKKKKKDKEDESTSQVKIVRKWDLPKELKEVSGIAYLDANRFACIQDEKGVIFIYNRQTKTIEKQVPFRGAGDYEAIALNGNMAYVATGDGELFEVNMSGGNDGMKKYNTSLTAANNVEGLCYDKKNNRLLLAIKDDDPASKDYKGIYAFDLATKSFIKNPVYKINMNDARLNASGGKKKNKVMPSEIGIQPLTNEFYITDGPNARLLILNSAGAASKLLALGKSFEQPEGITFSPAGEVFISNEGNKEPGNIIQIEID